MQKKNNLNNNEISQISKTIVVEGNIGCGKSTLLKYLSRNPNFEIYPEPVHLWQDMRGNNLLQMFYSNPEKYSFTFQLYAALTMFETHKKISSKRVKIMERSILSIKHCFIESLKENGVMEPIMSDVLKEWLSFIERDSPINIDCIVYLRSSPETIMERIKKRNRTEEANITIDQLSILHKFYEEFIQNHSQCRVIKINADVAESAMEFEYQKIENEINSM